jgi:hypothetical protein
MGQAATTAHPIETQLYITDLGRFMATFGIRDDEWSRRPAMEPDVSVFVAASKLQAFRNGLKKLSINGQPLFFDERENGFFALFVGNLADLKDTYAVLDGKRVPFEQLGLKNTVIQDRTNTNAYHIPTGSLLIYDPRDRSPKAGRVQVSTVDIAPAILRNFAAPVPDYMAAPAALNGRARL